MRHRASALVYLIFTIACLAAGGAGLVAVARDDGRIAEGVHVQGVDLAGLTKIEAVDKLRRETADLLPPAITLIVDKHRFGLPNGAIGRQLDYDQAVEAAYAASRSGSTLEGALRRLALAQRPVSLPLRVSVNRPQLANMLREVAPKVLIEPRNARVTKLDGDRMETAPGRAGVRLNLAKTIQAVENGAVLPAPREAAMVLDRVEPKASEADLRSWLNTRLATWRTNMSNHYTSPMRENRRHNVELCLPRFRGVVLAPGDEFSFNGIIGERKESDGFKSSIVFKRGADGSIDEEWEAGGGICQLATALFDAAVMADLKITERVNHSKVVGYSKVAEDAAVYWGVADLRFRNTLTRPIMVWGEMQGWDLVITIMGDRADESNVEMISSSWTGAAGRGGTLHRTVTKPDGTVVKRREWVANSFYPREPEKPAEPAPARPSTTKPAVASPTDNESEEPAEKQPRPKVAASKPAERPKPAKEREAPQTPRLVEPPQERREPDQPRPVVTDRPAVVEPAAAEPNSSAGEPAPSESAAE